MRRYGWLLLLIPVLLAAGDYLPDGGVNRAAFARFGDFGTPEDYEPSREIYFPKAPENYWLWGMNDAKQFIRYEKPDRFYWATKPSNTDKYTTARVVKNYYSVKMRIRPLTEAAPNGVLAIRYKDNIPAPTSVELWSKGDWRKLGTLGGVFDHCWKTAKLPFDSRAATADGGTWIVRIGRGDYGDLRGDLPIDWAGLALQEPSVPGPTPGFWPTPLPSAFFNLGHTMAYAPNKPPQYLTGMFIKGMRLNSWENYSKNHVNALIFQGWETQWRRMWETYTDGGYNDRIRYGFPEWLEMCAKNKLLCSSQFFTDTRSYWIERQYGNEEAALDNIGQVIKFYPDQKGNLCWFLKDEADHTDDTWGAPPEFVLQLYNLAKKYDPTRPAAVLFQGWKPGSFAMYQGMFDIAAFDVYPLGVGRSVTEIAERIERMRQEVGENKALWAVVEAHEGEHVKKFGRQLTQAETLVQGYLCLAHDIHGVFYYIDNEAAYIDVDRMPGPWAGIKQFSTEVNGPNGIAPWFLPPSTTVSRTGVENGKVEVESTAIQFIYKKQADGTPLLVALNTSGLDKNSQALEVKDLPAGLQVRVLFENRSLTSGKGGAITDDFAPYARHVYTWSK